MRMATDDGMRFDPRQGTGWSKLRGRPELMRRDGHEDGDAGREAGGRRPRAGGTDARPPVPEAPVETVPETAVESDLDPRSMYEQAVAETGGKPASREHVASPSGAPSKASVERAARAYQEAMSESAGEVMAAAEGARDSSGAGQARTKTKTVRLSVDVVEAAKREFPDLTNPKAVEAFVAYHASRPELAPEGVRDEVERRLRDGVDASGMAASIREIARVVADLKTIASIGSMASVAQLAHWYEDEMGRSGVPLSEWLGLSDGLFEISGELSSQSARYYEAMRRSHGRIPKGF